MKVFWICLALVLAGSRAWAADANVEVARQHYEKAAQFYDLGRFEDAIREFEAAYQAKQDPVFLYNLAQSFRRLGDNKRALDLYKNFLLRAPETPKRAEVEARIQALQALVDRAAANGEAGPGLATGGIGAASRGPGANGVAATSNPPGAPDGRTRVLPIVGLSIAGVGVLGIAGGVAFGLRARSLGNQVSNAPVFVASDDKAGKNSEVLQWVCYGAGAAALATGAVLFYLGWSTAEPAKVAFTPMLLPQGAGLATGGTF